MSGDLGRHQEDGYKKLMDAVFEQSRSSAARAIDEAEKNALTVIEESEKFAIQKAQEIHSAYKEMAEIEARKEISKAEIEARMGLLQQKESYVDLVLIEAKKKLQSFAAKPEYKVLLLNELKVVSKKMPIGELLINPEDVALIGEDKIKRAAGSGVSITPKQIGTGGFIAIRNDGRAAIDRSIDSILENERKALRGKIAEILFG
jgi:vacuolar-type H+-ATPase subunit E/Vma4